MAALVQRYYEGLTALGMELVVHFSSAGQPSKYGAWGLVEASDQDPAEAPKQQGLFAFLDANAQCAFPPATNCEDGATCSGHGFCLEHGCSCFYGYSGEQCETAQYTVHKECGYHCTFDQGVCKPYKVEGLEQYWRCECGHGYWGTDCSRFDCADNCNYNGMCVDLDVCSCFPGYTGERCQQDCGCNGHGECTDAGSCQCDNGWKLGANGCEWDCACAEGVACMGPGMCECEPACAMGDCVGGVCHCWAGFTGPACSDPIAKPNDGSPIGMNLGAPGYGLNRVFVDVMKHSSDWVSVPAVDTANTSDSQYVWGDGQPIHEDSNGYLLRLDSRLQEVVTLS